MRAFIVSMVLLAMIIGGSLFYIHKINKTTSEIVTSLEALDTSVKDQNWENAEKQLDAVQASWKSTEKWMTTLINHSEIDSIKMSFAKLSQYVHFEDTTEYMAESGVLKFLIRHISTKESMNFSNLF